MTRILVTGATGFVGRALSAALLASGHEVIACVRDQSRPSIAGARRRLVADVGPETDWRDALAGVEAVAHLAARVHVMDERAHGTLDEYRRVNALGTRRLAECAAAAGVRRLLFLSTVKVHGERTGPAPFREADPPRPADDYARSKWEGERALREVATRSGLEAVVLRPPLVYGPGVAGNMARLLDLVKGAPPLPLAAIDNRRSLLYVGNLASAAVLCLTAPRAAGETYLVRDGEDVSTPELIRRIAAALGRRVSLFAVPPAMLRLAGALAGRAPAVARLLDSLTVDDQKIREQLGWVPPFTMAEGLAETVSSPTDIGPPHPPLSPHRRERGAKA